MEKVQVAFYPNIRIVKVLPPFPENSLGLKRGSYIYTDDEEVLAQFKIPAGQQVSLCYDGKDVRCENLRWSIDELVEQIKAGIWKISDKPPVPDENIPIMELAVGGGQVTADFFWKILWDMQEEYPEMFKLRTSPDVSAQDMRETAAAAGKKLFIRAQLEPGKVTENEDGWQATSVVVKSKGKVLPVDDPLTLDEKSSGDRFFLCQLV